MLAAILAQASPIGGATEVRVWLAMIGLVIGVIVQTFGVIKYIMTLKIAPLEKDLEKLEGEVKGLQEDLLRQVVQIAEDNASHRLEQQRQHGELRLLLSESYVKKSDVDQRFTQLNNKIAELRASVAAQRGEGGS